MGQRTQIILVKENLKRSREIRIFRHNLGYGKMTYMTLIELCIQHYNNNDNFNNFEKFRLIKGFHETSINFDNDEIDINNPKYFKYILERYDNNNGGLVIYLKQKKDVFINYDCYIGFLLGSGDYEYGDETLKNKYLNPFEYGRLNIYNYQIEAEFLEMFDKFCKCFNIKYLSDK